MAACDESHVYLGGPEVESHVFRTADSLRLLRGIGSRDAETRRQALDVIARTLDGYVAEQLFASFQIPLSALADITQAPLSC